MSNLGKNRRNEAASQPAEPSNPAIIKARDQIAKGDNDGAASTLRQLLRTPDLALASRVEAAKLLAGAGAQSDAIATYLDAGRKALEVGDLAAARTSFAAAHTLDQKSYDALYELGRVDLAEDRKDQALEKFVEVLRKSNLRHLPALYEAAVLYEADGQSDQAIAAYKKIAERDRHHVPTLSRLADLYRKKGLLGDALGFYLQGARAAMQAMQYKEARRLVDNALQIEDDNWEARRLQSEVAKADPDAARPSEAAAKETPRVAGTQQPAKPVVAAPVKAAPAPQPAAAPSARPVQPSQDVAAAAARLAPAPAAPRAATPPTSPTASQTVPAQAPRAAAPPSAAPPPRATSAPTPSPAPVEPADIGSDMDTDLPAEVSLLEKQSEVTSRLAAMMGEVAEASKKRVMIERDIKTAQTALDALNAQRGTVESSIAALKEQLESVAQAKAAEDKTLDELRSKLESQRADLEKLATLPQFVGDIESKSNAVATLISNASATVEAAQKKVAEAANNAGSIEKAAADLMTRIGAARQQADEAQEQLKGVLAESKSAKTEANAAVASVAEVKTTLAALQALKAQVDAARTELRSLSPAIEAKRAQAAAAIGQLDQSRSTRDTQFQAAASQLGGGSAPANGASPQINGAPPQIAKTAPPSAPARAAAAAPQPAAVPQPAAAAPKTGKPEGAKVDIDALLVAGRLDEALRAAREAANGSADADARMIEAAERLREGGNAAAAAKACEKLVSAGNNSSTVRYCRALAYVDLKRFKEAMPMFDALADADYGVLRENGIGLCLRGLGRADEAAQHFSKALEIPGQPDGQYRDVLYNLADLYESRGDQESLNLAMWSFEEIQAGVPDYRDVGDRIASLKDQLAKIEVPEPNPVLTRDGRGGRDARF
jgi:tetratricopeptide (TPR) repeat protein